MNSPPLRTKGMSARYKALLSLIVKVSSPGLFPPGFMSFVSCCEPSASDSGGPPRGQPAQQALQRQPPVERRVQRGLELPHPVQHLEELPYIQICPARWQVGASAHFCQNAPLSDALSNAFREPVLKAPQAQRYLRARPLLGRGQ